jgi:hypothetical protein
MEKTPIEKSFEELKPYGLGMYFMVFIELLEAFDKTTKESVVYSKSYFSRYYGISLETFNKWIMVFCPDIWEQNYKGIKKFTNQQAEDIFDKLGMVNSKKFPPSFHNDLMKEIYKKKKWKKSKCYYELSLDISNSFPGKEFNLNRIPPKLAIQIIIEAGNSDLTFNDDQDEFFKLRMHALHTVFSKYKSLNEHQFEVRMRYLRRWFSKDVEDDFDL